MDLVKIMLCKLSKSNDFITRAIVAENPETPVPILKRFLEDENSLVKRSVWSNPSFPSDILIEASKDKEEYEEIKMRLAQSPATPINILVELYKESDDMLKYHLTKNPSFPSDLSEKTIEELMIKILNKIEKRKSSEEELSLRYYVTSQIKLYPEIEKIFARYDDPYIKMGMLCNKTTSKQTIEQLLQYNFNKEHLREMITNDSLSPQMIEKIIREQLSKDKKIERYILYMAAANKSIPIEMLKELAEIEDNLINEGIAENITTPEEILRKLSKCPGCSNNLASNPSTPLDIVEELFEKGNDRTRAYIALNPRFLESKDELEIIIKKQMKKLIKRNEELDLIIKEISEYENTK